MQTGKCLARLWRALMPTTYIIQCFFAEFRIQHERSTIHNHTIATHTHTQCALCIEDENSRATENVYSFRSTHTQIHTVDIRNEYTRPIVVHIEKHTDVHYCPVEKSERFSLWFCFCGILFLPTVFYFFPFLFLILCPSVSLIHFLVVHSIWKEKATTFIYGLFRVSLFHFNSVFATDAFWDCNGESVCVCVRQARGIYRHMLLLGLYKHDKWITSEQQQRQRQ